MNRLPGGIRVRKSHPKRNDKQVSVARQRFARKLCEGGHQIQMDVKELTFIDKTGRLAMHQLISAIGMAGKTGSRQIQEANPDGI